MHHGMLARPLDLDLDIAALQFKLGNVFFDEELYKFFQLFLIHSFYGGTVCLTHAAHWKSAQTSRAQILPGCCLTNQLIKKTRLPVILYPSESKPHILQR